MTDLRDDGLDRARAATYARPSLREVPDALLEKRFVARGDRFELDPRVRSLVSIARHDLGRDPWPRQLDAILMRNVSAGPDGRDQYSLRLQKTDYVKASRNRAWG